MPKLSHLKKNMPTKCHFAGQTQNSFDENKKKLLIIQNNWTAHDMVSPISNSKISRICDIWINNRSENEYLSQIFSDYVVERFLTMKNSEILQFGIWKW